MAPATLTRECEDALRTSVATACAQVVLTFETLHETSLGSQDRPWAAVLSVVHAEIVRNAREYNATHTPALRLPPELLHAILEPMHYRERLRAGAVCQAWMSVAYAFPLPVHVPRNEYEVAVLTRRLRHITPAPLQLERVDLWDIGRVEYAVALYGFLRDHMWRIQHLDVSFSVALGDEAARKALLAAFRTPASQLRRLRLYDLTPVLLEMLGDSWFGGQAPRLTVCRVPWQVVTSPAFRSARKVGLHASTFPHLESLHLGEEQGQCQPAGSLRVSPTLQHLWILGPARLLDCVDHSQIPHIHITYPHEESGTDAALAEDMRRLAFPPATHIDMHLSANTLRVFGPPLRGTLHMRTYDAARRYCRVYELPEPTQTVPAPPAFFAHVTSLSLAGLATGALGPAPYLPTVLRLAVSCVQPDVIPLSPCRPPNVRLRCPALMELVLHGPRPSGRGAAPLPAADAAEFVRGLDLRRALQELAVRSARLVDPGVDALRALVGRLELDPGAAPLESWIHDVAFERAWGPELPWYGLFRA